MEAIDELVGVRKVKSENEDVPAEAESKSQN